MFPICLLFFYRNHSSTDYVLHPINSIHLLSRSAFISKWTPQLNLSIESFKSQIDSLILNEDYQNSLLGLADIHEYSHLDLNDIAEGNLYDFVSERFFKANSGLTSGELIKIAQEARKVRYLEGYVNWLTCALHLAKKENKSKKFIHKIRYFQFEYLHA